jgi:2-enoate reductase
MEEFMIKKMFEPITIGDVYLKNRIVFTPCAEYMQDAVCSVSEQQVNYFAERARGGVGLICQNSYASDFQDHAMSRLDSNWKLPRFSYLTQAVHAHGAKMALMLSAGRGRKFPEDSGEPPLAASAIPVMSDPDMIAREMTTDQVYELIGMYKRNAGYAKRADYDFIMIQGYGGYLIDEFMTELWNKRIDEFGGSLEARLNFPKKLIEAIREVNGDDYPIIFKMSPEHMIPGGREIDEGVEIAKWLEREMKVAAIEIDTGCHEVWYRLIPPVWQQERQHQFAAAKIIKEHVKSIPVFTMGKVGDPEEAERVFEEGCTDLVALGRSFIADAEWANKVAEDRVEDIIPCICCLEGCVGRVDPLKTLGCAVNPKTGLEGVLRTDVANVPKKIIVVGAGPAGFWAAQTAAERGYDVEVWEKSTKIGGLLNPASSPAFKKEMIRLLDHYKAQFYKNPKIRLRLNHLATAENLLDSNADVIILATGGIPIVPAIDGVDKPFVHQATDVLQDKKKYGRKCVVIGAGYVGCETACHLDYIGKDVTLIEMRGSTLPDFPEAEGTIKGFGYPEMNRMMMNHMIYDESHIDVRVNTKLLSIKEGNVVVEGEGKKEKIECDEVVFAIGFTPNFTLERQLQGKIRVITVGDANKPGKVIDAVWAGYASAASL